MTRLRTATPPPVGSNARMSKTRSLVLLCGVAACGQPAAKPDAFVPIDAPADSWPDAVLAFEAPHPPPPTVLSGGGSGSTLTAPNIVPVFFGSGDGSAQAQIESFFSLLPASDYWATITHEYGVGAMTVASTVIDNETPPTTDQDLQTLIEAHALGSGSGGWPANTPNTIYTVYLPDGVTLTDGPDTSCVQFDGYHFETTNGVVYALIPRCTSTTFTGTEILTIATSHELLEASTDPHPETNPGFNQIDNDDAIWQLMPGSELGDMCEFAHASFQPLVGSNFVQRTWSNVSAAAGHDPCVPVLATPYVEAAVNVPDRLFDIAGQTLTTRGIALAVGSSATVEVDLFSDAPTDADWTVVAFDAASKFNMMPTELTFSFDKATGHNGDKLQLTVTRVAAASSPFGVSEFVLESQVEGVTDGTWWTLVD